MSRKKGWDTWPFYKWGMMNLIPLIKAYLRRRRDIFLFFTACLITLIIVYHLYGLPYGPAAYTSLLIGAFGLAAAAVDFRTYRKKLAVLETAKAQAATHLGVFPPPDDRAETLYQELIQVLEARCRRAEEKAEADAARAAHYYTLWSHQIKTPISAMNLLLQEEKMDKGAFAQELLKTSQYVDMVLQYQRLEASTQDLSLREYRLDYLVKQAVKRTAPLFIHKKIALELGDLSGSVLTDEKWLVFVLEQLLTNAVKYTPAGKVAIFLEPGAPDALSIQDTGMGIQPEDVPRVFEWGYTGFNGRVDKRSTGIGLSLCKQALEMLGHTITLTSRVGEGTRVVLSLHRKRFDIE